MADIEGNVKMAANGEVKCDLMSTLLDCVHSLAKQTNSVSLHDYLWSNVSSAMWTVCLNVRLLTGALSTTYDLL